MDSADVFTDVFWRIIHSAIDGHLRAIATGDIEGLVMGTDGNHPQAECLGVLDRVLSDCAQAKHGTPLASLKLGRLESAPGGNPGAGQVSGLFYAQSVRDKTNVGGVGFDVLGVPAINLKPGQDDSAAQHMPAVKTVFTVPARTVHKGYSDPVADRNASDICANRSDCTRAPVARNAWQLRQGWSWEITSMSVDITVTYTASFDFDENFPWSRLGDGDIFHHKRLPNRFYDGSFHLFFSCLAKKILLSLR